MAADFGMIGLGTMGGNLVLNIADHGFAVCGYDRDASQQHNLLQQARGKPVTTAASLYDLVQSLKTPRIIMLLVPAGKIVDTVITDLFPLLQKGDVIIDGGNSYFMDTARRFQQLETLGIHFIGMGVSGGEEGARVGPSLMPGGNEESFAIVQNILEAIAARSEDGPCVAYIGNSASGHYTKMVHNGIEYALMQLISEVYDVLKTVGKLTNAELHEVFKEWNSTTLQSFLMEITADIFLATDATTGHAVIDVILDKARQKGTGMWTSQSAMELNVPTPVIDAAVTMRFLSSIKDERQEAARIYSPAEIKIEPDKSKLIYICKNALQFAKVLSFAQGLHLLSIASVTYKYEMNIAEIIRIWKGGCIIRSVLLNDLHKAYLQNPALPNVIQSPVFTNSLAAQRDDAARVVQLAAENNIPVASLGASLNYFNAYCSSRLPANLIQAQRDYFGAHTYERLDKTGRFHRNWQGGGEELPAV